MRVQSSVFAGMLILALVGCQTTRTERGTGEAKSIVPFGVVLNSVERGARIYCPIRLLPFEHPDSLGHDYPNPERWHQTEADALNILGKKACLGLEATVKRYPRPVGLEWPYPEFLQPSPETIERAEVLEVERGSSPIPGLRAVAFEDRKLICFLIDTRGMTLEERGMVRPTTMGLDISRAKFLDGMAEIACLGPEQGAFVVVFGLSEAR